MGTTASTTGPRWRGSARPATSRLSLGPPALPGRGALYKPWTSPQALADFAREKVKYAEIIHTLIQENQPDLILSKQGCKGLAIPKP